MEMKGKKFYHTYATDIEDSPSQLWAVSERPRTVQCMDNTDTRSQGPTVPPAERCSKFSEDPPSRKSGPVSKLDSEPLPLSICELPGLQIMACPRVQEEEHGHLYTDNFP